jgi:hypothetical protein
MGIGNVEPSNLISATAIRLSLPTPHAPNSPPVARSGGDFIVASVLIR